MKLEFLNFVKLLMKLNPEYTESIITENVKTYLSALEMGDVETKPILTDTGKIVLKYMQGLSMPMKSSDIAIGLGVASRTVSGAIRKLKTDGFIEKIGDRNALYVVTEKGKEIKID